MAVTIMATIGFLVVILIGLYIMWFGAGIMFLVAMFSGELKFDGDTFRGAIFILIGMAVVYFGVHFMPFNVNITFGS